MDSWLEQFARANFRRSSDTAHDLKTPLNVAVLNLELLRMRVRKLTDGSDDEKLIAYALAIETELRRMARIFDCFFLLSTPPKNDEAPAALDLAPLLIDAAQAAGYTLEVAGPAIIPAHESRIRQAVKMFFDGAAKVLASGERAATAEHDAREFRITVTGNPVTDDFELTKIFKFYYTDPAGNPDLSLATARLIAETYGGELNAWQESDKVSLRLSFSTGER
ncbi:MAG TPA: histidine kinase dimerization/phospho-acceptor domain-containing protein [Thermoanaerobaculia bacterium]|nr:histidine kinase dimerization/phospho-acceptor domain-containing protein [Thermoanaerobaculia bacterium]